MQERDAAADWTASGVVALTGHPDAPPLVPPGRAASVARELGEMFDVDGAALLGERAALTGRGRAGRVSVGGACRLLPLASGWAAVSCARADDTALLGALVEESLPVADPWPRFTAAAAAMEPDTFDERAALLGLPAAAVRPGRAAAPVVATRPHDVTGRLVVSFGALWAAPLCAQLLAGLGARVVTVETPGRPDGARRGEPRFHALLHAHDRAVRLDPDTDRDGLHALVRAADVVIEASRPRALRAWGLDAGTEVARGATWISITAAGRSSNRVGFGDDVAASAGLVALDATGRPVFVGDAIADPLTGLTAAALAVTAPGKLHDVAMTHVVRATLDGSAGGPAVGPVAPPRARPVPGPGPAPGADTAAVMAELGVPWPS
ncbi:CoA transferase [Pseudonocardia sulfidoxydans NBRC 16205]|uniref:CoA transferase n=1 Tax=Pseudonocardia sulfidoxydans NBRC 16205 TaxID=1223511 RepID=A0A511DBW8_9PSEU|nr:CoA transferase [Pseudonocardia sulfidoxydans]GEL22295.1 CoA transferase [Pseudonocardia sulfidoxydans NBRC 16205]